MRWTASGHAPQPFTFCVFPISPRARWWSCKSRLKQDSVKTSSYHIDSSRVWTTEAFRHLPMVWSRDFVHVSCCLLFISSPLGKAPYASVFHEVPEIGTLGSPPPVAKWHQEAKASGRSSVGMLEAPAEIAAGLGA